MNLYVLDANPTSAARFHNDRHVSKAILECVQLLVSAHVYLNGKSTADTRLAFDTDEFMRETHINHPNAVWTRTSRATYVWVYMLLTELLVEYRRRNGRAHAYTLRGLISPPAPEAGPAATLPAAPSASASHGLPEGGIWGSLYAYPLALPIGPRPPWPQCVPPRYQRSDTVEAYRLYYYAEKRHLATWNGGRDAMPWWFDEMARRTNTGGATL